MKITTNLKHLQTTQPIPASPTKANLPVPWPRLEPQVAQSTCWGVVDIAKRCPPQLAVGWIREWFPSQKGCCLGPQPQCHKLQKKRFETSQDQHWLTVTAQFYHCLVHFSIVPAKQCWPRPRGETDNLSLAGIQIRPVPAAHSHIAFSRSTSRHPSRPSAPVHHMLSGKASPPSSGWGGHGPPIPWSHRPGSSRAACESSSFGRSWRPRCFGFPLLKLLLLKGLLVQLLKSENKNKQQTCCYNPSSRRRSPMRRVLAKECHYRLVPKHLHKFLDLLEEIHGRNMNCPCDVATCAVFTAQVDHNHILLIPKLGHTKEIQRMHNLVATKHEKTITSDEQTNMRESLGTQVWM